MGNISMLPVKGWMLTMLVSWLVMVDLPSVNCRGIGTQITPSPQPEHINNEDVMEDILNSWIIPRIISNKYRNWRGVADNYDKQQEVVPSHLGSEQASFYQHPITRGRRGANAENADVILPWQLKYFSPMLRG